jgi:hypothetical protein
MKDNNEAKLNEPKIEVKNKDSNWVALDIVNSSVISEGVTPEEATEKAEKISNNFMLMFVPKKGETYIF